MEVLLAGLAGIFVLGVSAQWLAWELRIPSIILLLSFGFLAGPVGGWIEPDRMFGDMLQPMVSLFVAIVLFEGGLSLKMRDLREIGRPLFMLLTVGAGITWVACSLFAYGILGFDGKLSLLLGAILVVTGPTVVIPMLRTIRPSGRVGPIARWEGIVIDPIGAILAVIVFDVALYVQQSGIEGATGIALAGLFESILIGVGFGAAGAFGLAFLLRRHWIPDHLQSPVTMMAVIGLFSASNLLHHESGLLTVTLLGVLLANQKNINIKHILSFKEDLSVLLISVLFIVLTARLDVSQFTELSWRGPLFVAAVILIARPATVFLSTWKSGLDFREKIFLAWLAPRGIVAAAVASVFALDLGSSAAGLVPATFLVIVGTVLVYGFTLPLLARSLGLSAPNPQGVVLGSAHPISRAMAKTLIECGHTVLLVDSSYWNTRRARMEGLPVAQQDILSEAALDDLDFGGIGRFLALTPNDEVNALAALHFSELFGRANVYQLPPAKSEGSDAGHSHLRGRDLFSSSATFSEIERRFNAGAVVKATRLSKEFDYEAFQKHYNDDVIVLFVSDDSGKLIIRSMENETTPKPGQTVIALTTPSEDKQ